MSGTSSHFVLRRVRELSEQSVNPPQLLATWRDTGAFVLLAGPGAGKTEAFKAEEQETGGMYVTARDFITLKSERFQEKAPLYIDGLDEIRAGSASHCGPLDDIRRRLDELGNPAFRLSCREADWRSAVDQDSLRAVAPKGKLVVLHLQDLDDDDIMEILRHLGVGDPQAFLREAENQGIRPLLGNPLLLHLMVNAVGRDGRQWPSNRTFVYQMACERLATEYNEQHRAEPRDRVPSIERILEDAGLLSALWLLVGMSGFSDEPVTHTDSVVAIDTLPAALGIGDVRPVLSSKLFAADGRLHVPRHRSIAEFLAARVIASRIASRLPVERILALMSGSDGGIVDPLRGLHAWLTTHCKQERSALIDRDPLGVVLYGDLKVFSTDEKLQVLRALHREAQRFAWFRKGHWEAQPFGALGTIDMADSFHALLIASDRSLAHQSLLGCVLEAIEFGESMPSLLPHLKALVRDQSYAPGTRLAALDAWLVQPEPDWLALRALLDDIEGERVSDPDDELRGRLLSRLYPKIVTPREIFKYFRLPKAETFYGLYQDFWRRRLISLTPREALRELMDEWASLPRHIADRRSRFLHDGITSELLAAALATHGDNVPVETVYRWLGTALDDHSFAHLSKDDLRKLQDWLNARPSILKALVSYGWERVRTNPASGRRNYWESEERLLGATRPADWYSWLLEQAAHTDDEELARYCFYNSAHIAINPRPDFILTMEMVEEWVKRNHDKWRRASEWLEEAWSTPLDHWQRDQAKRKNKHDAELEAARLKRRSSISRHLPSLIAGTAPAALLHQVAWAYDARYMDIRGDTPTERVQDFLGGTIEEANSVVSAFELTLNRKDLPDVEEILKTAFAGRFHYMRTACLLGAALAYQRDPKAPLRWPDDLMGKLAAFWLTDGIGEEPEWFPVMASHRPAVIAPVLERIAVYQLKKRSVTNVAGLWALARDNRLTELARIVVPGLLRALPVRAKEGHLRILNGELLPAAIQNLPVKELSDLIVERTALKSLDIAQRIAYFVAGLGVDGEKYSRKLLQLVGASESRAAYLGQALEWQGDRKKNIQPLPALVLGRLIELIAPFSIPELPTGVHSVSDADHRRDWAYHLINQLAAIPSKEAGHEIARLRATQKLTRWASVLEGAAFDQARARRDATFQQASVGDVANVLANKEPANARDLAALVMDQLQILQAQLRGDDTNRLRHFRRDDRNTPRMENECRDILLDLMRGRMLELGVSLHKEGPAVQDSRVDLRAEFVQPGQRFTVPIEIKKEDHRDLWSAWRVQLRSYMLDPTSDGIGVYLVLWFGTKVRPSPEGHKPSTPQELQGLLSTMIPEEERFRLRIAVLDLSFPRGSTQ